MSRQLHFDQAAEREANEIAFRFMNSSDVVGDMSRAYGADLSGVRIHTDESAARRVEGTGADAFSTGKDVFFGRGVFDKSDPASRGLLAHELAHSLQQGAGGGMEGAVEQSAPVGAAQGGLLDWFREHFTSKGRAARKARRMTPDQIAGRMPEANPGQLNPESFGAFDAAMTAPGGAIEASNHSLATTGAGAAKVSLGLRESTKTGTQTLKEFRGSLMNGYVENIVQYMHNLENGGMDFGEVLSGLTTENGGVGNYDVSEKAGQMSADLLSMFGQYAQSDQGVQYLGQVTNTMKQADVFGGDSASALKFMLQDMLLGANGGVYPSMNAQKDSFKGGSNAAQAAVKVTRLMQKLPVFSDMSPEEKAALPEQVKPLLGQYEALVRQIGERLGINMGQ